MKTCFFSRNKSMEPYAIVRTVFDAFKGLPRKLADISSNSEAWYASHGRAPKTEDPIASGNASPVTHYVRYCRKFEAVEPGAGLMLNNRVFAALDEEFTHRDLGNLNQGDLHVEVIDETCDVEKWLARFDIKHASRAELLEFEKQCDEAIESVFKAKSTARARIVQIEMERRQATA